ncbi:MAG TPA: hypothetical protein VJV05_01665 [Pyrinomonadaceae bacterium]|nr:hypothetical protein [Pyrinomonadaceae bacterium]
MRVAGFLSLVLLALLSPLCIVELRANDKGRGKGDKTGIREIIPNDARARYDKWKEEILSTEFGRQQWDSYASSKEFLLTIVVSNDRKFGAGTGDFEWDDNGKLIAATITLGKHLDKGYPDPVYYPVMNSLATYNTFYEIDGAILASTKFIHEIGHVNFTAQTDAALFRKQDKLIASYNSIFLKNGYDTNDPRLLALAEELGAKPIEIWENREYQSEASAMRYLMQLIDRESFYCSVMDRMKRNINFYARNYQSKFLQLNSQDPCAN